MDQPKRFISLSIKFAVMMAVLPLVAIVALSYSSASSLTSAYEENLERLGRTITKNLGHLIEEAVKGGDYSFQEQALSDTLRSTSELNDALILNGEALETLRSRGEAKTVQPERLQRLIGLKLHQQEVRPVGFSDDNQRYVDFVTHIYSGDRVYRTLVLGYSLEGLDAKIAASWRSAAIAGALFVLVGLLLAILLSRSVTRPIKRLTQAAARIAAGNLDQPVEMRSGDEVGLLAHALERMRVSLSTRIKDIARRAMTLEGDLNVFSLPDLLQFISTAGRTGVLVVSDEGQEAKVFFRAGALIHGELGTRRGEQAVYALFNWTKGAFRFDPALPQKVEETIVLPWQHVIMEGARRTDEMDRVRQLLPSPQIEVELCEPPEGMKHIRLNMDELQISLLAREKKTVGEILKQSHLDEIRTYQTLYGLLSAGLLERVKPER